MKSPGALFHTGDPHAAQGNGEVSISAIESANAVTIPFIVRKDLPIKTPYAETPTHSLIMGLDVELSLAMRKAKQNHSSKTAPPLATGLIKHPPPSPRSAKPGLMQLSLVGPPLA